MTTEDMFSTGRETRAFSLNAIDVERRDDGSALRLSGYAAVFNQRASIAGLFDEVIRPGAFRRAIEDRQDVALLFNHDPNTVIARTTNGTLRLSEDESGLWFEAELDARDSDAQRVVAKVESGIVSQCSFAFDVPRNGDRWQERAEPPLRELLDLNLYDVSPVTYPAYPTTSVQARNRANEMMQDDQPVVPATVSRQPTYYRRRIDLRRRRILVSTNKESM